MYEGVIIFLGCSAVGGIVGFILYKIVTSEFKKNWFS